MERIIKGTMLAGLLPGLMAPIIWPIVVLLVEGGWPTWSTYPMAALSISFFAIIIALPCCVGLGAPALFGLNKLNLNSPAIAGILGFTMALLIFFLFAVSNDYPTFSQSWPLATFFAINGAIAGTAASLLSRTNKQRNTDSGAVAPPPVR